MKILHLEDNLGDADLVQAVLSRDFPDCSIQRVDNRPGFLAALAESPIPDLILSDFTLPQFNGLLALDLARVHAKDTPFVFLSGSIGEERALAAVRAGAYDYVLKDNMARLSVSIRRAVNESTERRIRRDNERRLKELAEIIERASEAIMVSDVDGRITLWNDGAARLYGITAAEAVGKRSAEIFSQGDLAILDTGRGATLKTGEWRQEAALQTRDGRKITADIRMTLVRDAADQPKGLLSIANDITEKKNLEEQFLRAQRLEGLGMIAAGIAHDFNNVLAPLTMAAPLLRMRATDPADCRLLDIVESSSRRGAGLVRQILGFARGAGGSVQPLKLQRVITEIEGVIQASFPKSVELQLEVPSNLGELQANPTQLHQVILNLVVNARDAMMPEGGTLTLRASQKIIDEQEAQALEGAMAGRFIVLEVTDTGKGIPSDVLARIWTPFFTTKGEGKGTGLGLSTVRGIVAAHGGFVTVATQLGRGTTFRVFLPVANHPKGRGVEESPSEVPRGNGESILVVDDEAALREVTAATLSQHGYRVHTCETAGEAVAVFRKNENIHIVVTDINMPKIDGPALARMVRDLRSDVRILAVTGLGSGAMPFDSPAMSVFDERLHKPFRAEALQAAVHRLSQVQR